MANQGIPLILTLIVSLTCFLAVPCASNPHETQGPLTDDDYVYHQQLDDNYNLTWKFNSTHIQFHIEVQTLGYVGFGISNHGDMYPGDMVIVWKDGETVHFHDRHANDRVMPVKDLQQDWHLLNFKREDNLYNTFTVVRKLNTCDEDDIPIEHGTSRVIYAYSDAVPTSDDVIPYHGSSNRGTKSILLLDPPPIEDGNSTLPDDVFAYDLAMSDYAVPSSDTTYACVVMKVDGLTEKHHMIGFRPVIQKGHEKLVHHIVLYACFDPIPQNVTDMYYQCYVNEPEEISGLCEAIWLAWGIGGTGFNYPPNVGHSLGTPLDPSYLRMEVHYDNVDRKSDFVDSSGVRLLLTKTLRTHDAGMLTVGVNVGPSQIIPPKAPEFLTSGACPSACFQDSFDGDEIKIFGDFLHSHLIGKRMVARHVRDGVELPPIIKDDHYDFNYQETRALTEERVVKKGDSLITDCYYDSTGRDTITHGGLSSREEMCLSFILYYPRINLTGCYTRLLYTKNRAPMYQKGIANYIQGVDWSLEENRAAFAENVLNSDAIDYCEYSNTYVPKPTLQPRDFVEYEPQDVCQIGRGASVSVSNRLLVFLTSFVCLFLCTHARQ